jgi:hypothetical protein
MGSFRIRGQVAESEARALQQRLENEFGIFTVVRLGLADGACVRVMPQVFTSPEEIARLTDAITRLSD